jgi:hypothetical protein
MTGLSIKTLASALWGAWSLKATAVGLRENGRLGIAVDKDIAALAWQRRDRLAGKLLAALAAKSERMEALERVVEAVYEVDNVIDGGGALVAVKNAVSDYWHDDGMDVPLLQGIDAICDALAALEAKPDIHRLHIPEGKASAGTAGSPW